MPEFNQRLPDFWSCTVTADTPSAAVAVPEMVMVLPGYGIVDPVTGEVTAVLGVEPFPPPGAKS